MLNGPNTCKNMKGRFNGPIVSNSKLYKAIKVLYLLKVLQRDVITPEITLRSNK